MVGRRKIRIDVERNLQSLRRFRGVTAIETAEDDELGWRKAAKPFSTSRPNIFIGAKPKTCRQYYLLLLLGGVTTDCLGR
jgi:hypothetical protein